MDDDSAVIPIAIFLTFVIFGIGCIGYSIGSQDTERNTIKYCIEQQAKCKVKYDYIKLGETK
jgi:hypothetical protein